MGNLGKYGLGSFDTHHVGGHMEGSQVVETLECFQNIVVDDHGLLELLTAVKNPVAYGLYFAQIGDASVLGADESLYDPLDRFLMGGTGFFRLVLILSLLSYARYWKTGWPILSISPTPSTSFLSQS